MNWGNGILVVFLLFATLIGTLVYKSSTTKIDLVSKNYYEEELLYQDKMDGMKNVQLDSMNAVLRQNEQKIWIQWPADAGSTGTISGEAWFYCSYDAARDKKIPFTTNGAGLVEFDKSAFRKGDYQVKISWGKEQAKIL